MLYTALKGWNFQIEQFSEIKNYFNPTTNYNFNLTPQVTLHAALTGFKKVFNRQFLKEWYEYQHTNWGYSRERSQLMRTLLDDEEIPVTAILALRTECDYDTRYDEEEDVDEEILTSIYCELYRPATTGSYIAWSAAPSRSFAVLDSEDWIGEIKAWVKSQFNEQLNLEEIQGTYTTRFIDASKSFIIHDYSLQALWKHHFGRTKYYRREVHPDDPYQTHTENSTYLVEHLITHWRSTHAIAVDNWGSPYNNPTLSWCIPIDANDRSQLWRIQQYSADVTRWLPNEGREAGEEADNLYGVELEVSTNVEPRAVVEATEKPYCVCKSDSTITGRLQHKYEIVSMKATLKHHKKNWAAILDKVGYQNFDVTRSTNNGMHVHVDMNAFKNAQGIQDSTHQKHFVWFFCNPVNRAFQTLVSERDEKTIQTWAGEPPFTQGRNLPYLYHQLMTVVLPPFRGVINFKQSRDSGSFVTIEVRLFKGIVSLASIWKNLEYVDSVFNFTTKSCFQSNNLDSYLSWLKATPTNRYATLKEFLKRADLKGISENAKLKQLLWGTADPEKVIYQIKRYNIPIGPNQLITLNTLIEDAKFALQDGQLVVVETNRSAVYDLDMVLHNKLKLMKGAQPNVPNSRS